MRIGIIGAGRIGGNAGKLFAKAGHQVMFSYSRDPSKLEALARDAGNDSRAGTPREAVEFGEVMMLSVPWAMVEEALEAAGPLDGKVLIDTTNQFTSSGMEDLPDRLSAAEYNERRSGGARLVKSYNTMTAGFQAEAAGRTDEEWAVMFYAGEDEEARHICAEIIRDSGFEPVEVGGWGEVWIMEAPRREGSVYGEEYRPADAREIAEALRSDDYEEASRLALERKVG